MKQPFYVLAVLLLSGISVFAQSKKDLDRQSIKDMCGCYKVTFKYTETFAPEIDYEKKLDYTAYALEWAEAIEDSKDHISLQHLLIVNDSMVIKHWRQDWDYENKDVFYYDKDNSWVFTSLPEDEVKGQWTQKVYQVDDSPRYSGSATWIHADGKHYWENTASSPLPRREYSKRSDYNVMERGNRQEITSYGWMHEQDNNKVVRADGEEDVLLAQEKGYNTYTKLPDEDCKVAQDWWKENKKLWKKVRKVWAEVYDREGAFTLKKSVEDSPMFMHFYKLNNDSSEAEIRELIEKFIAS
ncbi:DUF6607 family protein [Ulvibacter litoralis]|uniref:Uncharacterized protein n=1 Tax=Ulvibacter litoralis TaxID=227084 RepID=A0A1G7D0Z2_9FLAO|nr:DUF6607 family protein [Ulvibacter litoralis]GHC45303.1 hypothetical protein GCM10008083_05060 [Ulvibacter litoralis]SDE45238.1 hypothetical protein SAMN05421855_101695 [Ulvibacter litoralis]